MIRPAEEEDKRVRDHLQALGISSMLMEMYRRKYRPMAVEVTPEGVVAALNRAGIRPVLMGTHGLVGYRSESRATQGVDVLVRKKDIRKAVKALQAAYPDLRIEDTPVVTRFVDPSTEKVVIDVMKPTQEVFKLVFRHTVPVEDTHDIPDLEMALVSKFAAMTSPRRIADKKMIDGGDFINIVRTNRGAIDLPKLRRLTDKVYPGGGAEVLRMIEDVDAGRTIQL
jgi:hypothetical protein